MNEETIISFAIDRSSRSRYREGLSNPKKRAKLLDKLNHNPPLDTRYTTWYSSFKKAVESIKVDPKREVFILSDSQEIDGKSIPYEEAISEVPRYGWGTIICITPTHALYYGEHGESVAIIHKKDS